MTAQTTTTVDEEFWELVLSDPDLLDIARRSLADPADPTGPGEVPPADGEPGDAGGRDHRPRLGPPRPWAPPARTRRGLCPASGRVRSPPPDDTHPEGWEVIRGGSPAG